MSSHVHSEADDVWENAASTPSLPPVLGFTAPSGMGKTTLLEQVIAQLSRRGYRVAALKHGHHPAEPDTPGKDSHRLRLAGAATVLFAGPGLWFMVQRGWGGDDPELMEHLARLVGHDLILVEGYHQAAGFSKIAVHRVGAGIDPEWLKGRNDLVAVATDAPDLESPLVCLPLNDPARVADFIVRFLSLSPHPAGRAG